MEQEIWKPVNGFEGLYEVSSLGRIKMLSHYARRAANSKVLLKERIVKEWETQKGYLCVDLFRDGKVCHKKVHRLVAIAFVENPDNKPHIDHIDTNKKNNSVNNLRWVTPLENKNNLLTRRLHSRIQSNPEVIEKCMLGRERIGGKTRRIAVEQYGADGVFIAKYNSMAEAEKITGVKSNRISTACAGKISAAGGYQWKYATCSKV